MSQQPEDISRELRIHDDPRLYHEADRLMCRAADEIDALRAQVERLQAEGQVASSAMEIVATWRDYVLHGRGNLESVLDNDQTNEVLSVFDDMASELRSVGVNKTIPPASELLAASRDEVAMAWNTVRAEARALGSRRVLGELLAAVEMYGDRRVAEAALTAQAPTMPADFVPRLMAVVKIYQEQAALGIADAAELFRAVSRIVAAQALPAAEPVAEFFAFSSEMGFERFKSKDEAIKCAQDLIDYERSEAQHDGEWGDEVETVCWGVVMAEAKETPEYVVEEGFPPSIDYVLEPATPQAAQQAAQHVTDSTTSMSPTCAAQATAAPKLDTDTLRPLVARLALEIDPEAVLETFPEALAFQIDMARAVIRAALPQPQPQSAQAKGGV